MRVLLGEVMKSINNYFEVSYMDKEFTIDDDGTLSNSSWLKYGQWIAVTGSIFHNGVWKFEDSKLSRMTLDADEEIHVLPGETFEGRIWSLAPPMQFIETCKQIGEFAAKMPVGALASESFGAYSHSYQRSATGGVVTWNEQFKNALDTYRHMFTEVSL